MKNIIALIALLGLVGCQGGKQPNIELVQNMMEQQSIKAQEFDAASPQGRGMRTPPENTVPQGFTPYKWGADAVTAEKENKNPIAGESSQEVMMVGQKYYFTQCSVCHGESGEGGVAAKSTTAEFMALKPPSLLSDKVRGMNDARIYHIITMGQGVMGPHASHIPAKYRWQVVNYIRSLQKQGSN